jgi:hypothetical protein
MTQLLPTGSPSPRRSFFRTLGGILAVPFAIGARSLEDGTLPLPIEPWRADADALGRWRRAPRHPILDTVDNRLSVLLTAIEAAEPIEFVYDGGSRPGAARRVTPGALFRVEGFEGVYLSGYCHTRAAERTFQICRICELNTGRCAR